MPKLNIVIHGHQESYRESLINYKNIIFTNDIKDSLKYLYKSNLLITPISGFGRFALNCGIKNLVEIVQSKSQFKKENTTPVKKSIFGRDFNPFNSKIYSIRYQRIKKIIFLLEQLICIDEKKNRVAEMLNNIGIRDRVWPLFVKENMVDIDSVVGLNKDDFRSIGISLGDANKIFKSLHLLE